MLSVLFFGTRRSRAPGGRTKILQSTCTPGALVKRPHSYPNLTVVPAFIPPARSTRDPQPRSVVCERCVAKDVMDARSLNEKASEETLISLLQLDPSPIESPQLDSAASDEKQLAPPSDDGEDDAAGTLKSSRTGASNTSSLGLSGSGGHGAVYYCSSRPSSTPINGSLQLGLTRL